MAFFWCMLLLPLHAHRGRWYWTGSSRCCHPLLRVCPGYEFPVVDMWQGQGLDVFARRYIERTPNIRYASYRSVCLSVRIISVIHAAVWHSHIIYQLVVVSDEFSNYFFRGALALTDRLFLVLLFQNKRASWMHGLGALFFIEQTEPCKATIIKQCAILDWYVWRWRKEKRLLRLGYFWKLSVRWIGLGRFEQVDRYRFLLTGATFFNRRILDHHVGDLTF